MLKKLTALAMAVIMMLMCAAVQADAATNTPLETVLNTFTEKYADNDSNKIEIQNVYMLTAQDGAALNDDARRLFTNSDTQDDSYDALIYIIARQNAYDFPIPHYHERRAPSLRPTARAQGRTCDISSQSDADWQTEQVRGRGHHRRDRGSAGILCGT